MLFTTVSTYPPHLRKPRSTKTVLLHDLEPAILVGPGVSFDGSSRLLAKVPQGCGSDLVVNACDIYLSSRQCKIGLASDYTMPGVREASERRIAGLDRGSVSKKVADFALPSRNFS